MPLILLHTADCWPSIQWSSLICLETGVLASHCSWPCVCHLSMFLCLNTVWVLQTAKMPNQITCIVTDSSIYIHIYTFYAYMGIYKQRIMILSLLNTSSCIWTYAECHFIAVCTCSKFPIHSQNRTKNNFMMLQLKSKMVLALDFTLDHTLHRT